MKNTPADYQAPLKLDDDILFPTDGTDNGITMGRVFGFDGGMPTNSDGIGRGGLASIGTAGNESQT